MPERGSNKARCRSGALWEGHDVCERSRTRPMKRKGFSGRGAIRGLCCAVVVCGLSLGCNLTKVEHRIAPGVEIGRYRSFGWLLSTQPVTGFARLDDPALNNVVQVEMQRGLAAKGYVPIDSSAADMLIAYEMSLTRNTKATGRILDRPDDRGWGKEIYAGGDLGAPDQYVEETETGTLTIQLYDAATRTLVFRGTATANLDDKLPRKDRLQRVQRAVRAIIGKVPKRK